MLQTKPTSDDSIICVARKKKSSKGKPAHATLVTMKSRPAPHRRGGSEKMIDSERSDQSEVIIDGEYVAKKAFNNLPPKRMKKKRSGLLQVRVAKDVDFQRQTSSRSGETFDDKPYWRVRFDDPKRTQPSATRHKAGGDNSSEDSRERQKENIVHKGKGIVIDSNYVAEKGFKNFPPGYDISSTNTTSDKKKNPPLKKVLSFRNLLPGKYTETRPTVTKKPTGRKTTVINSEYVDEHALKNLPFQRNNYVRRSGSPASHQMDGDRKTAAPSPIKMKQILENYPTQRNITNKFEHGQNMGCIFLNNVDLRERFSCPKQAEIAMASSTLDYAPSYAPSYARSQDIDYVQSHDDIAEEFGCMFLNGDARRYADKEELTIYNVDFQGLPKYNPSSDTWSKIEPIQTREEDMSESGHISMDSNYQNIIESAPTKKKSFWKKILQRNLRREHRDDDSGSYEKDDDDDDDDDYSNSSRRSDDNSEYEVQYSFNNVTPREDRVGRETLKSPCHPKSKEPRVSTTFSYEGYNSIIDVRPDDPSMGCMMLNGGVVAEPPRVGRESLQTPDHTKSKGSRVSTTLSDEGYNSIVDVRRDDPGMGCMMLNGGVAAELPFCHRCHNRIHGTYETFSVGSQVLLFHEKCINLAKCARCHTAVLLDHAPRRGEVVVHDDCPLRVKKPRWFQAY